MHFLLAAFQFYKVPDIFNSVSDMNIAITDSLFVEKMLQAHCKIEIFLNKQI